MASQFKLAKNADGIPLVASTTERDVRFPAPATYQRVQYPSGQIDLYTGTAWMTAVSGGKGNTGTTLKAVSYGVTGDGTTNDAITLTAALTAAAAIANGSSVGATVELPAGVIIINSQIVVPNYVRLVGQGRSATVIKAGASFPTSTPLVRLGAGTDNFVFGCRVENLAIYCNNVAGSTGVYSTEVNEQSGCRNVLVHGYRSYAINIEDSGSNVPDHFLIDDCETSSGIGSATLAAVRIAYPRQGGQIRRLTVNRNDSTLQPTGVWVVGTTAGGCHLQILGLNVEGHTDGVLFDTNAGGTVIGATLLTAGTNLVRLVSSQSVKLGALYRGVGTNTVKNDVIGQHMTSARVMRYETSYSVDGYQVFTNAGPTSTHGNVLGTSGTTYTIKSSPTSGSASRVQYQLLDGNNDGWLLRFGADGTGDPLQLIPMTAGVAGSTLFQINDTGGLSGLQTSNGPVGTLTLGAAATTVVSNTQVTASSLIYLFPTNAAAATLVSGSKSPYISARSAGVSFTVATADATAAAGTETFNYLILN